MDVVGVLAENDQLKTALRKARDLAREGRAIIELGGVAVLCPACGSKKFKPCYGNGLMARTHEDRDAVARRELAGILAEITEMYDGDPG